MEKGKSDNIIHHIQRINQYKVNDNFTLKYYGSKARIQSEDTVVTQGLNQYSRRIKCWSNNLFFMNEMIMEYYRMTFIALSVTPHDNKACFDRIVNIIATQRNENAIFCTDLIP